ncbi:hypothetical protein FRC09_007343 [Ceratobasidium sp. 395]|nr:hypothetical protein FRC09_007343 [Ceratobasidium sp. 395]
MSTALCPRLVALDPSVCTTASCKASHTHEPAFCDPCKAVHAAVHAGIHVASIGHRLRVDGPVAPVRCVVCAPLPGPPPAQFLFVGPEHYVAHARTSAHRAKLAQFPPAPVRTKTANGLGLGRPGSGSFHSYTRSTSGGNPYAAGAAPSPPGSRNVTPTPGTSRPGSSMSFSTGQGFSDPPPGPPPIALEPTEYVICALCHTVLPVPLSDVWPVAGSKRNVSGGSDLTVRGAQDDDHDDVGSVVTTTENDTEVRKSLVLANHMSTDNEHARRVKFPKFRAAYEKRIAKERRDAGLDEEEERPPVVGFLTHSPDQVSLSSLSSSPSVDVQGLDDPPSRGGSGGGLFFHQHHRHRRTRSVDSSGPADPPEPRFKFQHDDEFVMQRQRSRSKYETSSNGSSERVPIRVKTQPQHGGIEPPAYVREHNLPITIPDHLLPYLSPITPSTVAPDPQEELERYGRNPTSEYLQALPIRALSTPIRTTFMLQPDPEEPSEPATTPSPPPERLLTIPEQPTPAESITSSPRSKAYEPSPSPPPRLAFDDLGRVIKLGSLGWERQTGPMYDDFGLGSGERASGVPQLPPIGGSVSSPATPIVPSFGSRSVSVPVPVSKPTPAPVPAPKPAPSKSTAAPKPLPVPDSDSSDSEPEPARVRKAEEKSVVSGSVGTVQVKRYTLNRDDTMKEPVRDGLASSGRAGTMPGRSSAGRASDGRLSNEFGGRSSNEFTTPGRSSTLGPGRSSLGLTTTATRPVAPRNSTGEWAVLGSGSGAGGRGFDEFGARVGAAGPSFGGAGAGSRQTASLGTRPAAGAQPWLGSGSQNGSRPGSRVRMVRSPEELSSQGSESRPSPPYFNFRSSDDFRTSRLPEDGSESSASEASQLIRGFDSPPLDLNLGTPEMLSPRPRSNWSVSGRGADEDDERASSPEKNPTLKRSPAAAAASGSPSAKLQSGSPSTKPIPTKPGQGRQQFASPTPSRPFSPTLAWNGLTPASPLSSSRSPSLSSSTGGEIGTRYL